MKLSQNWKTASDIAAQLELPTLEKTLRYTQWPNASDTDEIWHRFSDALELHLRQRGFEADQDLWLEEIQILADYLRGNLLLLQCLELSEVRDRAAIEDQMLLPPASAA